MTGDDFDHKREIVEALGNTELMHDSLVTSQQVQYLVLALRLTIAYGRLQENATKVFRSGIDDNEGDLEFWAYHLSYYRHEVVLDDLGLWNDQQIDYYRKHANYQEETHMKRRKVLEQGMKALQRAKGLWPKIERYVNDTVQVNHFMSVVQTRFHYLDIK
jgi:hypothetical protein